MTLDERFKELADEWEAHRQSVLLSSNIHHTLNHPAYRALIELGPPALPLIIERYRTDDLPWGFVLQEITGIRRIEDPRSFRPDDVKRQWIEWWEHNEAGQTK